MSALKSIVASTLIVVIIPTIAMAQVKLDASKPAAGNTFIGNSGGCISEAGVGLAVASANLCR